MSVRNIDAKRLINTYMHLGRLGSNADQLANLAVGCECKTYHREVTKGRCDLDKLLQGCAVVTVTLVCQQMIFLIHTTRWNSVVPLNVVPNAPMRTYAGTSPVNQSFVTIL
jgi:hypothetical protein